MLSENITCAFKNKVTFIKLEIKSECLYYLEARKKNQDFISNLVTWNASDKSAHYFLKEPVRLDPRLGVLKFFEDFYRMLFLVCCYFFPIYFLIFHNTVLIYNTRNRSNDKHKVKEKRHVLMLIFIRVSHKSRD